MPDKPRPLKGLFFDLYGTLLVYGDMDRAWDAWLTALHGAYHEFGLQLSREEFALKCKGLFSRPEPPSDGSSLTVYERRLSRLAGDVGLNLSATQLGDAAKRSIEGWHKFVSLDPIVPDLLDGLGRRVPLALITNFDHPPHIHRLLDGLDLTKQFSRVTVSAEIGISKPDPRIFAEALAATGLEPSGVAYVGDTGDDIEAARRAGMIPILIQRVGANPGTAVHDYGGMRPDTAAETTGPRAVTIIGSLMELEKLIPASD